MTTSSVSKAVKITFYPSFVLNVLASQRNEFSNVKIFNGIKTNGIMSGFKSFRQK